MKAGRAGALPLALLVVLHHHVLHQAAATDYSLKTSVEVDGLMAMVKGNSMTLEAAERQLRAALSQRGRSCAHDSETASFACLRPSKPCVLVGFGGLGGGLLHVSLIAVRAWQHQGWRGG